MLARVGGLCFIVARGFIRRALAVLRIPLYIVLPLTVLEFGVAAIPGFFSLGYILQTLTELFLFS